MINLLVLLVITLYSITCSSPRIFPGHLRNIISFNDSLVRAEIFLRIFVPKFFAKCRANSEMSSLRSFNTGIKIGNTFKR